MELSPNDLTFEFPNKDTKELLRELVLYIATASQSDPRFGKTKLVKLLYLSDFGTFREYGEPITGHRYVKLPNGPFPDDLDSLLREMEDNGEILWQKVVVTGYSHPQERIIPRREVRRDVFRPNWESIAFVDALIRDYWDHNGTDMANLTHGIAYHVRDSLEPIPYEASIISDEELTQEDLDTIDRLAAQSLKSDGVGDQSEIRT
jgi:Antitoxin SocA-like, Panacea domain